MAKIKDQAAGSTSSLLWPLLPRLLSHCREGDALSYTLTGTTSSLRYCGGPRPTRPLSQCYQLPVGPHPVRAVSAGLNTNQQQPGQAEWQTLSSSVRPPNPRLVFRGPLHRRQLPHSRTAFLLCFTCPRAVRGGTAPGAPGRWDVRGASGKGTAAPPQQSEGGRPAHAWRVGAGARAFPYGAALLMVESGSKDRTLVQRRRAQAVGQTGRSPGPAGEQVHTQE